MYNQAKSFMEKTPLKIIITMFLLYAAFITASGQSDTIYYFNKQGGYCNKEQATKYRKVKLIDSASQLYANENYSMGEP
jgi:hypothetical protein